MKLARIQRRRSNDGGGVSPDSARVEFGFQAMIEGARFKKPRHMQHRSNADIQHHIANGDCAIEMRYVLMEYSPEGNKQLKAKMMTRLDAYKRNQSLARTGFAWAMCGK